MRQHIYIKTPTADLEEDKPQLPDEEALGVTYNDIDDYLEGKEVSSEAKETIENHYVKMHINVNLLIHVILGLKLESKL